MGHAELGGSCRGGVSLVAVGGSCRGVVHHTWVEWAVKNSTE